MLPAPKTDRVSLADVMPSSLAAIAGEANRMGLPRARRAVVVLVDGLGAAALASRAGHARTLAGLMTRSSIIEAGFPTTTAAALATLTTGVLPGQHGMVGYSVLDAPHDRVVKQLSGWDVLMNPHEWQPVPTVFERATELGFEAVAIGHERYRSGGFTDAVLRGARYIPAASIDQRLAAATEWLHGSGPAGIAYVYVPELDQTGHACGSESSEWTAWLETLDAAVRLFASELRPNDGAIITADHGVLDVPEHAHVYFDRSPGLVDGIRHVAGEPRCLQLHFEPDAGDSARERIVDAWRAAEGGRSWIATRDEAIAAGWFGEVTDDARMRIGDLLVAARKNIAYYDGRAPLNSGNRMIGQHGSWSQAELRIPLIRLGAFARS